MKYAMTLEELREAVKEPGRSPAYLAAAIDYAHSLGRIERLQEEAREIRERAPCTT